MSITGALGFRVSAFMRASHARPSIGHMKARNDEGGFSLIELMLILIIN